MALRWTAHPTSIDFEWDAVADATSYQFVSYEGFSGRTLSGTSVSITNLAAGSRHRGVFGALLSGGGGQTIGNYDITLPPAAPTGLSTSDLSYKQVTLGWEAVDAVDGYEVKLSTASVWTDIGNVLEYTFTGLSGETSYTLQVRAEDGGVYSAAAETTITTPAGPPPPGSTTQPLSTRYEIEKADGTTFDPGGRLVEFKIRYGANLENAEEISRYSSRGYLHIENSDRHYSISEARTWRYLHVYAYGTKVFQVGLSEPEQGEYNLLVDCQLLAAYSVRHRSPILVTVGQSNITFEQYIANSGVNVVAITGVDIPAMKVAGGSQYDGVLAYGEPGEYYFVSRYENDTEDFLNDITAFGRLLLLEEPLEQRWRIYPLPPPSGDTRTQRVAITTTDTRIDRKLEVVEREKWRRDAQILTTLDATTEERDETLTGNVRNHSFDGRPLIPDINGNLKPGRRLTSSDSRFISWGTVASLDVSVTPSTARVFLQGIVHTDGNLYLLRNEPFADGVIARWTLVMEDNTYLSSFTPERLEKQFAIDDQDIQYKQIPRPKISIPKMGTDNTATETIINDNLEEWNDWVPEVAFLRMYLFHGDEPRLDIQAGDIVNVTVGMEVDHRALVLGVHFKQKDLRPAELRWDVILLSELP